MVALRRVDGHHGLVAQVNRAPQRQGGAAVIGGRRAEFPLHPAEQPVEGVLDSVPGVDRLVPGRGKPVAGRCARNQPGQRDQQDHCPEPRHDHVLAHARCVVDLPAQPHPLPDDHVAVHRQGEGQQQVADQEQVHPDRAAVVVSVDQQRQPRRDRGVPQPPGAEQVRRRVEGQEPAQQAQQADEDQVVPADPPVGDVPGPVAEAVEHLHQPLAAAERLRDESGAHQPPGGE